MTLKKSTDRLLYLIGMAVTFLGLLIPYCRMVVLESVTVSVVPAQEAVIEPTESVVDNTVIVDENPQDVIEDADGEDLLYAETEETDIAEVDEVDSFVVEEANTTETIEIEKTLMLNVISGARYFNEPGIAYISTFIVIVWLAALVGVILYFVSNFVVANFIVWLIGAAFGIANTIAMALYCYDNEYALFGWIFIGSFVAFVGMTVALVGLVLSIKNIQHPLAESITPPHSNK